MNLTQAKTLQDLCTKYNAYGCEVWFVGIRFYLNSGKMSKVYPRKGLNLETGIVWINLNQFKENKKCVLKRIHPDIAKDKSWATMLTQFIQTNILSERKARFRLDNGCVIDTITDEDITSVDPATNQNPNGESWGYPGSNKRYNTGWTTRSTYNPESW